MKIYVLFEDLGDDGLSYIGLFDSLDKIKKLWPEVKTWTYGEGSYFGESKNRKYEVRVEVLR